MFINASPMNRHILRRNKINITVINSFEEFKYVPENINWSSFFVFKTIIVPVQLIDNILSTAMNDIGVNLLL